jgi:hypothetical protein
MTDPETLLERHRPVLRFDSQEAYFADSAAEWTDDHGQLLQRADGTPIAAAPPAGPLALGFLGPSMYGDGKTAVAPGDCIGRPTRDYVAAARRLHAQARYRNRMYGRWATGGDGRVWLQYWFWYFYNDYNLIGPFIHAGLHEGDWEMVQLRLDAAGEAPDLAVYAQHQHAGASEWAQVERRGDRPVVYPARGSHASYFTADTHWTGVWFDHADGKGASPELTLEVIRDGDAAYAWTRWPGMWGDTRPQDGEVAIASDTSPRGPGGHAQWGDPHKLLLTAQDFQRFEVPKRPPAPVPPPAPQVTLSRGPAGALEVAWDSPGWPPGAPAPAGLVVTLNSPEDPLPPEPHRVEIATPAGTAAIGDAGLRDERSYGAAVSVVDADGIASHATQASLPAATAAPVSGATA